MVELHNEREDASYEKAFETARNMIDDGLSISDISKYTGLKIEEIEKLK